MKRLIWFIILGCVACGSAPDGYRFKLKGDLINVDTGSVKLSVQSRVLFSAVMSEGQFVLSGILEEPGIYTLDVAGRKTPIVLDGGDMELITDYLLIDTRYLKGSPAVKTRLDVERMLREEYDPGVNAILTTLAAKTKNGPDPLAQQEADNEMKEQNARRARLILDYVKEHPDELYMPVFIREQVNGDYAWGMNAYELLSTRIQSSQPGRLLKAYLDQIAHTVEGSLFPIFTAEDAAGDLQEIKLDNGKVYVIDFWASWCGPCRAEMQHLKELYEKYAGRTIEFVSVSLDKRENDWRRTNAEERLPWPSVWLKDNFNAPLVKQLGIEGIPFIVVVDKEGRIAGKNLRDRALIDKINEVL